MKVQVEQNAQVVAQRSQHVEGGRLYVDAKRAEIDILLNRVLQAAASSDAHHQAAHLTTENLDGLLLGSQTTKANIDLAAESIATIRRQCDEHATTAKILADIAVSTEAKIRGYESRLIELEALSTARLKTIERPCLAQRARVSLLHLVSAAVITGGRNVFGKLCSCYVF